MMNGATTIAASSKVIINAASERLPPTASRTRRNIPHVENDRSIAHKMADENGNSTSAHPVNNKPIATIAITA